MKKVVTMCIVIFSIIGSVFATTENWCSFGYEMGRFLTLEGDDTKYTMNSGGIGCSAFTFEEGSNSGLYLHATFLLPTTGTKIQNGNTTEIPYSEYDFISLIESIVGYGLRTKIIDGISTYCGLGLSFQQLVGNQENSSSYYCISEYLAGIGGEIGLKVDFSDKWYLEFGTVGTFDFMGFNTISSTATGTTSYWLDNYSKFSARPYIMLGFQYFEEKTKKSKSTR
jgi:hypothetical protein